MKQELYINGEVVGYTLQTNNITSVLGKAYIYKVSVLFELVGNAVQPSCPEQNRGWHRERGRRRADALRTGAEVLNMYIIEVFL